MLLTIQAVFHQSSKEPRKGAHEQLSLMGLQWYCFFAIEAGSQSLDGEIPYQYHIRSRHKKTELRSLRACSTRPRLMPPVWVSKSSSHQDIPPVLRQKVEIEGCQTNLGLIFAICPQLLIRSSREPPIMPKNAARLQSRTTGGSAASHAVSGISSSKISWILPRPADFQMLVTFPCFWGPCSGESA